MRAHRDECYITHGEESLCAKFIEAHNECLRKEGFNVRCPPRALPPAPPSADTLLPFRCNTRRCLRV